MRIGKYLVAAGALAFAASLSLSAEATAATLTKCTASPTWGQTCWQKDGDVLWVYDTASDGRHVESYWYVNETGRSGRCSNTLGAGQVKKCNYDMGESFHITFDAQLFNGSDYITKTALVTAAV